MPQTETKFGTLFFEHFQLWNNIFSGKMSSIHHKTFKVNFAVLRKSIITQALNFVFDQKINGKLQNVEVVKTNTLQNNTFFFQITYWLLLTFILYLVLPRAQSKANMPKTVRFRTNSGRSRTPATHNFVEWL